MRKLEVAILKAGGCAAALALLAAALPASAHHSYAMFDRTRDIALVGTVKDWQWTNPHTFMILLVPDAKGKLVEWNLEGQSPQVLRAKAWNRDVVKVGDKVTVHIYPLRDGSDGGQFMGLTTASGAVFK